jgi:flagellar hook-associated protein 1 FlgK
MSLDASLAIAGSGLAAINSGLSVVSQNIANAGTADWSREVAAQQNVTASGLGMGVRVLPTQRDLDTQLQSTLYQQNATVAGLQLRQTALSGIDQVQGQVGGGSDLASMVGQLQDAFSGLLTDPSSQPQQQAVVNAASSLAGQVNSLAGAVGQARQQAQDKAVDDVTTLNTSLAQIGQISDQIVALQSQGLSTADLQNQRDAAIDQLSQIVPVKQVPQQNGDVLLVTSTGLSLPIHDGATPFTLANATLGPTATYPSSSAVPAVRLDGKDVTTALGPGGELSSALDLRDNVLPAYQGSLDEFAYTLASRFSQQGLNLFTDGSGNVPVATGPEPQSGYVGFANAITVNPAIVATPSLVRDGTGSVAGSATGASAFTPNPAGGPAGFSDLITRVLDFSFGSEVQSGVAQPVPASTGLGPAGDQSAGFTPPSDLAGFATTLVSKMSQDESQAGTDLDNAKALQTSLQSQLSSQDGVSIDQQMSTMIQLQNAYGANAKIITAVQAMWDTLLNMVNP